MKIILSLLFLIASSPSFASDSLVALQAAELSDQHDQTQKLDASTKWIIFSSEMDAFNMAKSAFEKLEIKSAPEKGGLLVSDISGMPSLVTKMFALPKMKKYSFTVALDRQGNITKNWPRKKGELTLIKLHQLEIKEVSTLKTEDEVITYLKSL